MRKSDHLKIFRNNPKEFDDLLENLSRFIGYHPEEGIISVREGVKSVIANISIILWLFEPNTNSIQDTIEQTYKSIINDIQLTS